MSPLTLDTTVNAPTSWLIFRASLKHDRFLITLSLLLAIMCSLAVALANKPLYRAESTLLVLLGSEYTYRTTAGENANTAGALSREQILRTEIEILQGDDLYRDVINTIGPSVLYPELLAPPGIQARLKIAINDAFAKLRLGVGGQQPSAVPPANLIEAALIKVKANVTLQAVKDGNAIELTFTHEDPVLAARFLALLEEEYLTKRREIYLAREVPYVNRAVDAIRSHLESADSTLAQFKKTKGISDYLVRQTILLNQQGALEADLRLARSQIDQNSARINQLDQQIRNLPGAYNTLTNQLMLQIQEERSKAQVELQAARAQAGLTVSHLADVAANLTKLSDEQRQMEQLTRVRDVLVSDYQASSKVRSEREVTETVELHRKDNVRVLQEARPPTLPLPTRSMILIVGAVLSVMIAALVALLMHFARRVYLVPEAVERDTGLRVLISLPDSRRLARSSVLPEIR
jgi:uncharacterized protein involved in exopolysaccharide biosynthesis